MGWDTTQYSAGILGPDCGWIYIISSPHLLYDAVSFKDKHEFRKQEILGENKAFDTFICPRNCIEQLLHLLIASMYFYCSLLQVLEQSSHNIMLAAEKRFTEQSS